MNAITFLAAVSIGFALGFLSAVKICKGLLLTAKGYLDEADQVKAAIDRQLELAEWLPTHSRN